MIKKKNLARKSNLSLKNMLAFLKNSNNRKILGTVIVLFSILIMIAFISYLLDWKADDSVLSKEEYTIFNNDTQNQIGGLGAQISHRFIKLWFGITALLIPFVTLLIGLKILGLKISKISKIIFNSILICS